MNAHASEFSLTIDPGRSAFSSAVDMPESELTDIPRRLPPSMAASAASPRALAISVIACSQSAPCYSPCFRASSSPPLSLVVRE